MEPEKKEKLKKIKQLRDLTKLNFKYCIKALEQSEGNVEKAIQLLKDQNLINSTKIKQNETPEGLTSVLFKKNKAILLELNTETDFVAKNKYFTDLIIQLEKILLEADGSVQTINDFLKYDQNNTNNKIEDIISKTKNILRENIVLSRIKIVYKKESEIFGSYKHQGGKISTLVCLTNSCPEVAKNLAIHITGYNPQSINHLLEQSLYDNPAQTINEYLQINKTNVIAFCRFEVNNNN
ncbi:translation elongation factor Ts [Candidatus Phytoplasma melaleucae]|uniref:Elongation factor Ts n=1 Tax=Candidatus Phytoplasma melaleucae TaxID=2982630 RepID=A0ABT9DCZ7_9MOLU|nr:translation elongation factor Ts ['Melaleuca sp.' phytoplasma]MDO8167969.1 translation elongation factor Ts ['Melaleuca sp.' phytoplasma]